METAFQLHSYSNYVQLIKVVLCHFVEEIFFSVSSL